MNLDLNCDLGEGAPHDAELMPLISSANIACGAHAGDEATMRHTLALARQHGVAVGAHPGYPDPANFGRLELALAPANVLQLVTEQLLTLQRLAGEMGISLTHVKPHGALYNQAARDPALADTIATAVQAVDPRLILFGLAGSALLRAGQARGLRTAAEIFADRRYQPDGSLIPRSHPDALITDPAEACAQTLRLLPTARAETLCIHGDGPDPVAFARTLRAALAAAGIQIAPCAGRL